jgi:putative OmpL-like beta-barrel porin-2
MYEESRSPQVASHQVRSAAAKLVALLVLATTAARADPDQPPATPAPAAPAAAPATPPPPKWYDELAFNAFVSAGYLYNTNQPSTRVNQLRPLDSPSNSFFINVAELSVQKAVSDPGSVGFRTDLTFGGLYPPVTVSKGDIPGNFDLRQAFASWVAPVGSGLRLDVGKFVTPLGYEVLEGYDGYNDNNSRSFLFEFAIPFTHTGVKATYAFSSMVSAMVGVVNGWDATVAQTKPKSFVGQVALTPIAPLTVYLNYVGGWEPVTTTRNAFRQVFDAVVVLKATEHITVAVNGDFGTEEGTSTVTPGDDAKWYGAAGYIRYEVGSFGIALRGEYFKDKGGTRLGLGDTYLAEGTISPYFKPSDHWMFRLEGRYDHASTPGGVFVKSDGTLRDGQPTIGFNAMAIY